jgi:hypothetical protein
MASEVAVFEAVDSVAISRSDACYPAVGWSCHWTNRWLLTELGQPTNMMRAASVVIAMRNPISLTD